MVDVGLGALVGNKSCQGLESRDDRAKDSEGVVGTVPWADSRRGWFIGTVAGRKYERSGGAA
jgi:hypothetical protein